MFYVCSLVTFKVKYLQIIKKMYYCNFIFSCFLEVPIVHIWHTAGPISHPGKFKEEGYFQVQSEVTTLSHVLPMCSSMDLLYG